jgi:hypothetical protein
MIKAIAIVVLQILAAVLFAAGYVVGFYVLFVK